MNSYRFMRILLFFDLPSVTYNDLKQYRNFRKYLIKNGFMMLQESVYMRLLLNSNMVKIICESLEKNKPSNGLVQVLVITEKQYERMFFLVGEGKSEVLNTIDRLVIL